MMTLLPVHLKKAFVRGHLRNLGGRMVEVKPYHTKTQPKRDDDRSRELFGDIPPAANQYQPRMHPARTTTPRTPIVPFKAVFPQLFDEKEVATVQNGQYNKDIKGRNPAPETEGTKMDKTKIPKFDPDSNEFRLFGGWNRFAEIIEGKQYAEKPEQKVDGGKKGIAWGIHGTWVKVDLLEPMMDWRKQNLSTHGMEGMIFDSLPGIKEAVQAIKQVPWVKEEPTKEAEKPATTTSSLRLSAAADYLEKEIAAAGAEADPDDLALVKQAIKALRETTRTDLESAVWPSIFSVLGIKNASHIASLLIEQEGKGFSKAPTADRIYLTVPFSDKDKVKAKGAKWDGDKKKWYWPTSAGDMPAVVKGYAPAGAAPEESGINRFMTALKNEVKRLQSSKDESRAEDRKRRIASAIDKIQSVIDWADQYTEDSWDSNDAADWNRIVMSEGINVQSLDYWLGVRQGWKDVGGKLMPPKD